MEAQTTREIKGKKTKSIRMSLAEQIAELENKWSGNLFKRKKEEIILEEQMKNENKSSREKGPDEQLKFYKELFLSILAIFCLISLACSLFYVVLSPHFS